MFMRAGYVIGQSGIYNAFLILLLANSITFFTGLSISAIATNITVKGGGAYYIISRVLGPKFGGAIGLALYAAQALSVPFYILGFTEALVITFPLWQPYYFFINLGVCFTLFFITYIGASWAIRTQYLIMLVLGLSIATFMIGMAQRFNSELFRINSSPHYLPGFSFWKLFAIYFPAVTGIMAGVNMSGDLKNPVQSLPRGTLLAIATGFIIYSLQILIMGGVDTYTRLIAFPFQTLQEFALFDLKFFVILGVFAATLSSALGSMMGAPRILQALSRDRIIELLGTFSQGSQKGDEPRHAMLMTLLISLGVIGFAGQGEGGAALNAVAAIVTIFFLYAYGIVNLAGFVESFGSNPSFRPRFKFFHWSTALLGTVACFFTATLISFGAAVAAVAIITLLFIYLSRKELKVNYGDARRGFVYQNIRKNLNNLSHLPLHPKNWRPTLLLINHRANAEVSMLTIADLLTGKHGLAQWIAFIPSSKGQTIAAVRSTQLMRMDEVIKKNQFDIFPEAVVYHDIHETQTAVIQSVSLNPLKPNLLLLPWQETSDLLEPYYQLARLGLSLHYSVLFFINRGLPAASRPKTIDLWWRGEKNGSLLVILAYLISCHPDWTNSSIRLLRAIPKDSDEEAAHLELSNLMEAARINAEIQIIQLQQSIQATICKHSHASSLILLGSILTGDNHQKFHQLFNELTEGLPSVLIVSSTGDANLFS